MRNYKLSLLNVQKKNRNTQRVAAYILARFKNILTIEQAARVYYEVYKGLRLDKFYDLHFNKNSDKKPTEEAEHAKHILTKFLDKVDTKISQISDWYENIFDEYELKIDPLTGLPCSAYDYISARKEYLSYFPDDIM